MTLIQLGDPIIDGVTGNHPPVTEKEPPTYTDLTGLPRPAPARVYDRFMWEYLAHKFYPGTPAIDSQDFIIETGSHLSAGRIPKTESIININHGDNQPKTEPSFDDSSVINLPSELPSEEHEARITDSMKGFRQVQFASHIATMILEPDTGPPSPTRHTLSKSPHGVTLSDVRNQLVAQKGCDRRLFPLARTLSYQIPISGLT